METETDYLQSYDPSEFLPVAVTVDLVLMTSEGGSLCALVGRRDQHPFLGDWALPGGFVGPAEGLEEAAARILRSKARVEGAWMEQLYSFGAPRRDPRMRVITVAYFALLPAERLRAALREGPELRLARLTLDDAGAVEAAGEGGEPLPLAFDHAEILGVAVQRLRGKLGYTAIAFSLLPELFTLRQLQAVHETILGRPLNKPAFRRRMLDRGWLTSTGERETGASYRPAELYRFNPEA